MTREPLHHEEIRHDMRVIGKARAQWTRGYTEFNRKVDGLVKGLLHDAFVNRISVSEIARTTGVRESKIRTMMRELGLNPSKGTTFLSRKAALNVARNADLLGVRPDEISLLSPLAYLPLQELTAEAVAEYERAKQMMDEGGLNSEPTNGE